MGYSIYRGILTGLNAAFIVDKADKDALVAEDPKSEELLKPILRGRDIKRYQAQWKGLWVILAKYGSHEYLQQQYPAIFKHLSAYKTKLQNRGQCRYGGKGNTGQHHWLELDNNPTDAYLAEFMRDKLV
ncbi:MAG: hypothetical protein M2R45_00474 [Verrucomicrobia subdivision 3 bacterium]|nr:hypothetical protein [Limisphaerales bacterium]MCS1413647.1 hypothetical protein [Limisphaerales bacterium]